MQIFLVPLFLITALVYSMVGFGGGSTYNALLVLNSTDYRVLPAIALVCNIIVVFGGVWRSSATGNLSIRRMLPILGASIPAASIGGSLHISETMFVGLLGFSLSVAGVRLFVDTENSNTHQGWTKSHTSILIIIGLAIGFLSGLVGIGGGVFLAPILYHLKWGSPKQIAGACSLFILVNSFSGLLGQLQKISMLDSTDAFVAFWPLLPAVLIGGQIGSRVSTSVLDPKIIKRLTAILILYVAIRLIFKWLTLLS